MKPPALLLLAIATAAHADVSHYGPLSRQLAEEGDRQLAQKHYVRALEEYLRVLRYDDLGKQGAHATFRIAQVLQHGSKAKVPCLTPFDKPSAILLLRSLREKKGQSINGVDAATEGKKLYTAITDLPTRAGHTSARSPQLGMRIRSTGGRLPPRSYWAGAAKRFRCWRSWRRATTG